MGRKMIEVKSLYESTIEDLNNIAKNIDSDYTRDVIQAIIQRYNGVPTSTIAKNLGKCLATIISYISNWNDFGIVSVFDKRGGNIPSSLTGEMAENIREVVTNKSPHDFGYEHNRWNSPLLARYIEDTYGRKYSRTWVKYLLKNFGFSYKRGIYKPTFGDEALQESFKKMTVLMDIIENTEDIFLYSVKFRTINTVYFWTLCGSSNNIDKKLHKNNS